MFVYGFRVLAVWYGLKYIVCAVIVLFACLLVVALSFHFILKSDSVVLLQLEAVLQAQRGAEMLRHRMETPILAGVYRPPGHTRTGRRAGRREREIRRYTVTGG